jgi:hypothetical protein
LTDLELKTKRDIEIALQFNFDFNSYSNLFKVTRRLIKDEFIGSAQDPQTKPLKVIEILRKPKKGSKIYRSILTKASSNIKNTNANVFKKFVSLSSALQVPVPAPKKFNEWWNCFGAGNKLREFIFKFCNNLLGLNSRVHHFNHLVAEGCTFCSVNKLLPVPRETFSHLFFDCPESSATLVQFEQKYLNNLELNNENRR